MEQELVQTTKKKCSKLAGHDKVELPLTVATGLQRVRMVPELK